MDDARDEVSFSCAPTSALVHLTPKDASTGLSSCTCINSIKALSPCSGLTVIRTRLMDHSPVLLFFISLGQRTNICYCQDTLCRESTIRLGDSSPSGEDDFHQ